MSNQRFILGFKTKAGWQVVTRGCSVAEISEPLGFSISRCIAAIRSSLNLFLYLSGSPQLVINLKYHLPKVWGGRPIPSAEGWRDPFKAIMWSVFVIVFQ